MNSSLYDSLQSSITTYAEDVHALYGYGVCLETVTNPNPEQVKSLIISYSGNLRGVLFVGDLSEAYYEINNDYGEYGYKNWPCDLFFMDLDGQWSDSDNNSIYDLHTGNVAPEIFLARMTTCGMASTEDEISLIKKQLAKSHNYWWKSSFNSSDSTLCYIDKDWRSSPNFLKTSFSPIYGYDHIKDIRYGRPSEFSPSDYINRLSQNNYGFTLLAAHSSQKLHSFTNGVVRLNDIKNNDSNCYLFNLFCCSACDWTEGNGYLGGAYLFNNGKTIAVIGSTKIGGMQGGIHLYSQFPSNNIGESYLYWWHAHCGNTHSSGVISWNYGMTILGDPMVWLGYKINDYFSNYLYLTTFPPENSSNVVVFKAGERITVSSGFTIPQGVHVIFDAPQIIIAPDFICPLGASFETRNEGCEL
jgi:hypothetical protein